MAAMVTGVQEVIFDVFPAQVRTPDLVLTKVRVAHTAEGRLMVWRETNRQVDQALDVEVYSYEGRLAARAGKVEMLTEVGQVVVTRVSGCGCGSVLRSFSAWPGKRRVLVAG